MCMGCGRDDVKKALRHKGTEALRGAGALVGEPLGSLSASVHLCLFVVGGG